MLFILAICMLILVPTKNCEAASVNESCSSTLSCDTDASSCDPSTSLCTCDYGDFAASIDKCCVTETPVYSRVNDNATLNFVVTETDRTGRYRFYDTIGIAQLEVKYNAGTDPVVNALARVTFTGDAATGDISFTYNNIQTGDTGVYYWNNIEDITSQQKCVTLYVLDTQCTPDVTVTTTNTTVNANNVDIVCSPSGVPNTYTYQPWTQHWGPDVEIIHTPGLGNNPTLQLTQLSYQHSGIYTCTAVNDVLASNTSAACSGNVYLLVKSQPIVTEPTYSNGDHHKLSIALNTPSSLVLEYYSNAGDTTVTVNSKIDGNIGDNVFNVGTQTPTDVQLPVFTQTVTTPGMTTTLTFTIREQQQFGQYEVVLRNENGLPGTLFKLDVAPIEPPEVPSHLTSANVTQTTAELTWVRGFHGGSDQTFVVQLSTDNIQWTNKTFVDDGQKDSNTSVTVTIGGLSPGAKYFVRVFAFNQEGHNVEYSNVHDFITLTVVKVNDVQTMAVIGSTIAGVVVIVLVVVATVVARRNDIKCTCQKNLANPQSPQELKNYYENVTENEDRNVQVNEASQQVSYYNIGRESERDPSTYESVSDGEPTPTMFSSNQNIANLQSPQESKNYYENVTENEDGNVQVHEVSQQVSYYNKGRESEPVPKANESVSDGEPTPTMYSSLQNIANLQSPQESKNYYENVTENEDGNVQVHEVSQQVSYYNKGRESEPVPTANESVCDGEPTPTMYSSLQNIDTKPVSSDLNQHIVQNNESEHEAKGDSVKVTVQNKDGEMYEVPIGGSISYYPEKHLGYGTHGIVFEGRYGLYRKRPVAVKVIKCLNDHDAKETHTDLNNIYKEIKALETLVTTAEKTHIIHFFDSYVKHNQVFLAFELANGTLVDFISNAAWQQSLTLDDVIRGIVAGLNYIHKNDIVHRDLKPANIFIVEDNVLGLQAVIGDFGQAKATTGNVFTFTGNFGSNAFIAPEIWNAMSDTPAVSFGTQFNRASDIFSLGLVAYYAIYLGKHPFGNEMSAQDSISKGKTPTFPDIANLPNALAYEDMLKSMLNNNPVDRPLITAVSEHPALWTSDSIIKYFGLKSDEFEAMIRVGPSKKNFLEDPNLIPKGNWMNQLPLNMGTYLRSYTLPNRTSPMYSGKEAEIRFLLRAIRNTNRHHQVYPQNTRTEMGVYPEGHVSLWLNVCPGLLMHVYNKLGPL